MKEMKFGNPVFHSGINTTVREGTKWLRKVEPGDEFMVEGKRALCHYLHSCRFSAIPDMFLLQEHDPVCRNIAGLYNVMAELYPNFNRNSVVTIVGFEVLE